MNETEKYEYWHEIKHREWEARCLNCGACCGALHDPCEYLQLQSDNCYVCSIYSNRFGIHKTVSGEECVCVPLRSKIGQTWPGDERCGYKGMS